MNLTITTLALAGLALGACTGPDGLLGADSVDTAAVSTSASAPKRLQISLSDPQVVQVVASFNVSEAQVAEAALPDLQRADVEAFVGHVVDAHRQSNESLDRLRDVVPLDARWSVLSQTLERAGDSRVGQLSAAGDVDGAYIASEIAAQTQALALIDCVMLLESQDDSLLQFLDQRLRPVVTLHLQQAEWLLTSAPGPDRSTSRCDLLCAAPSRGGLLSDMVRDVVCSAQPSV